MLNCAQFYTSGSLLPWNFPKGDEKARGEPLKNCNFNGIDGIYPV